MRDLKICWFSYLLMNWSWNQFPLDRGVKMRVTQLCPTLRDPMDYIVCGILQAQILEWVPIPFSRGSSPPRN